MKIKTRFNFGQIVQAIVQGQEQYHEKCPLCDGVGKLKIKSTLIDCVESGCYGKGFKVKYKQNLWYIPKDEDSLGWSNFVINRISCELYNPNNKRFSDIRSRIYYMADSSGTMWDENNIFASLEEAQIECDKRNKNNN